MLKPKTYQRVLKSCSSLLLCGQIFHGQLHAMANIEQLMDMSLEDLMSVQVSTASKKSELLSEAPSVMTLITEDEIQRFGAKNVRDLLNRIPNLFIFDSSTFTSSGVSLRAGATQHLNNHVFRSGRIP